MRPSTLISGVTESSYASLSASSSFAGCGAQLPTPPRNYLPPAGTGAARALLDTDAAKMLPGMVPESIQDQACSGVSKHTKIS